MLKFVKYNDANQSIKKMQKVGSILISILLLCFHAKDQIHFLVKIINQSSCFALKMNDLQISFATNVYSCYECYLTWANFNKLKTRQGNASLRLLQVVLLQQK